MVSSKSFKAIYVAKTESSSDVPLHDESWDPDCCAWEVGTELEHAAETKTDGSLRSSEHENGESACVLICGDGAAGEDAIVNACVTCSTFKKPKDVFEPSEACGEAHTLYGVP